VSGGENGETAVVDAYQNLPAGYVHLTYYGGLTSGALPQTAPGGSCLQNDAYYHDVADGGTYPIQATATVNSDGVTPGSTLDVVLEGVTYSSGPPGATYSLPDVHMTYTIYAGLPPADAGG
jgi:hypothetical protein